MKTWAIQWRYPGTNWRACVLRGKSVRVEAESREAAEAFAREALKGTIYAGCQLRAQMPQPKRGDR